MDKLTISRRALLASVPATAIVASATCSSAPALAGAISGPSLADAILSFEQAAAHADAFEASTYRPAYEAWQRAVAAIPHYTTTRSYESMGGGVRHMATAHVPDLVAAKAHEKLKSGEINEYRACAAELSEAVKRRDEEEERLKARFHIDELYEESNRPFALSGDSFDEIELFPVATLPDLIRKVEFLDDGSHDPLNHDRLLADLRRIEGRR